MQGTNSAECSCCERNAGVSKYGHMARGVGYAVSFLLLMGIFLCLFVATREYPKCSDDFSYSYVCGAGNCRVSTISDIIASQIHHYTVWGGAFGHIV